ncbi:MAG: MFS transporter [Prochlorococcus sp.]|jgi:MFS family permease
MTWWNQFPSTLKGLTWIRLLASMGAGGVIYMTPLIFHQVNLSATQIGSGLTAAALIGTLARLVSGGLIDRGFNCSWPVRTTALLTILADLLLLKADSYGSYLTGQLLIGMATGLYWPAIELAVPLSCEHLSSSRGYALVRSADALGISLGALAGTIAAWLGVIRWVYLFDGICMVVLLGLLARNPLPDEPNKQQNNNAQINSNVGKGNAINSESKSLDWLTPLLPLLLVSLVSTGMLALLQSALPLDLVRGGLQRPPLSESWSGGLIAIELGLLVLLQWPVGRWLADRSLQFGLGISLGSFSLGCLLLGCSALWPGGVILIVAAQLPMAFALAAFLPTATEAVIEESPLEHRGLAMALFSQCFAISAIVAPLVAGQLLDRQGHGMLLWLLMSGLCLAMLPLLKAIKPRYRVDMSNKELQSQS